MKPLICIYKGKFFNLGVMGRSASKSFLSEITGLHKEHNKIHKERPVFELDEWNNLSEDIPKILVLRNPTDRYISGYKLVDQKKDEIIKAAKGIPEGANGFGIENNFLPEFMTHHGQPFLHEVNLQKKFFIILFEHVADYLSIGKEDESNRDNYHCHVEDMYDLYTEEQLYQTVIQDKPKITVKHFTELLNKEKNYVQQN